jgi:transcriptional regulator with PAS, ATPase and Fis domain
MKTPSGRICLYRINTIEITLPPLRERLEDIPLLADHFIEIYAKKYNKDIRKAGEALIKRMQKYHWPGNIRELQHSIERAVIMTTHSVLQPEDCLCKNNWLLKNRRKWCLWTISILKMWRKS